MQREIKFRIWNPKEGLMSKIDSYYWEEYGLCDEDLSQGMTQEEILMQFTGLKDKNGKDIYEGDIILLPGMKGEVFFRNGSFRIDWDDSTSSHIFPEGIDTEVIGNIFENPNLIE